MTIALIEEIISSLPSHPVLVRRVLLGIHWTVVCSEYCGMASTLTGENLPYGSVAHPGELHHFSAQELAKLVFSQNHYENSVGVAAINSLMCPNPQSSIELNAYEWLYANAVGKDVAMQIAAAAPQSIDRAGVDASSLEHEKEVLRKQAEEEGKPAQIIEKMVMGRINKFYKEVCLNEQIFVKDSEKTVKDILGDVKVTEFTRFQLGEGIEKKQEDFAAEVAAQMK